MQGTNDSVITGAQVTLPTGRVVFMAQLTIKQFLLAAKAVPKKSLSMDMVKGHDFAMEGVKMSLRCIGLREDHSWEKQTNYDQNAQLNNLLRTREIFACTKAFQELHTPSDEDISAVDASFEFTDDGASFEYDLDGEHKKVWLREMKMHDIRRILFLAEKKKGMEKELFIPMEGVSKSMTKITTDGVATDVDLSEWPFGPKETFILAHGWSLLHMGQDGAAPLDMQLQIS